MKRFPLALALIVTTLLLAACGGEDSTPSTSSAPPLASAADAFAPVEAEAKGQTVRFWMFGGDEKINAYVDDVVAPAAKQRGVTVERVPVTDTADAVKRVVSERRAGKSDGGGVDMIWINGENFAAGKKSKLWLEDWSTGLPNAVKFVDYDSPAINTDFQVPVDGQESPWQSARFVYATDTARVGPTARPTSTPSSPTPRRTRGASPTRRPRTSSARPSCGRSSRPRGKTAPSPT